jgi:hypothetical protein
MILGKCDDGRPRGRGRFTLENGIGVNVMEIKYELFNKFRIMGIWQ